VVEVLLQEVRADGPQAVGVAGQDPRHVADLHVAEEFGECRALRGLELPAHVLGLNEQLGRCPYALSTDLERARLLVGYRQVSSTRCRTVYELRVLRLGFIEIAHGRRHARR